MLLETQAVVRRCYNKLKEDYPHLAYKDFEEICRDALGFITSNIEKARLPTIRVVNVGIFQVYSGRVNSLMNKNEILFKKGMRNSEKYNRLKTFYTGVKAMVEARNVISNVDTIYLTDDTENPPVIHEIEAKPRQTRKHF